MTRITNIFLTIFFISVSASIDNDQAWNDWKDKFGFKDSLRSEMKAYENFKENEEKVKSHNSNLGRTFDLALNEFSAMDEENFAETYFGSEPELDEVQKFQGRSILLPGELGSYTVDDVPKIVDNRHLQTPIQHQRKCGNCWAFGAAAGIENFLATKTQNFSTVLSQQYFTDCDFTNNGCHGGKPYRASVFAMSKGKIPSNEIYAYDPPTDGSRRRECKNLDEGLVDLGISEVFFPGKLTTEQIQVLVANHGAVVVSIWGTSNLQSYKSGILDDEKCKAWVVGGCRYVNHAVLIVGYNADEGYWIIKNSYGNKWGEEGYVRMKFDTCNINCAPIFYQ